MNSCWDKIIEIYKARLTLSLGLLLFMATLTGYALNTGRRELLLFAGIVPLLQVSVDLFVKATILTPFLYKALVDEVDGDAEPISLLFLGYGALGGFHFEEVKTMKAGAERQRKFRKIYLRRRLGVRALMVTVGFLSELFLWSLMGNGGAG